MLTVGYLSSRRSFYILGAFKRGVRRAGYGLDRCALSTPVTVRGPKPPEHLMPVPSYPYGYDNYEVEILRSAGPDRERFERELLDSGISLPLPHRCAWAQVHSHSRFWFVGVRNVQGRCCFGYAAEVTRSRALPGHLRLRVEHFVPAADDAAREAGLGALARYVRNHWRIISASLQVFSRNPAARAAGSSIARELGFRQSQRPQMYTKTVAINLEPSEDKIFASFHPTARRHIRAVQKKGLIVRPVTDPAYADRLARLLRETMARTGGRSARHNWAAIIDLSNRCPTLSRLIGLFRTDTADPASLLAFAWSRGHVDHADYFVAASSRPADIKLPLGYALVWDLLCWAKSNGATWFDFGGITPGRSGDGDPVGGISDFKRYFSRHVVTVSEEWVYEPRFLQARLANGLSATAAWIRGTN